MLRRLAGGAAQRDDEADDGEDRHGHLELRAIGAVDGGDGEEAVHDERAAEHLCEL